MTTITVGADWQQAPGNTGDGARCYLQAIHSSIWWLWSTAAPAAGEVGMRLRALDLVIASELRANDSERLWLRGPGSATLRTVGPKVLAGPGGSTLLIAPGKALRIG